MMRALTLIQPWAGLIATGVKLVENRTWDPPALLLGQQFVIHAGKKVDEHTLSDLIDRGYEEHALWRVRGACVAVATLERFVADRYVGGPRRPETLTPEQARFYAGPVAYVLSNVIRLEVPVPCSGFQKFWELPEDVEAKVRCQLSPIADLIERSSIGAGLRNIRENGIDAELADLEREMGGRRR